MKKIIFSTILLFIASSTVALEKMPFDQAKFDQLQKAGTPVLVDIYAPWCPTCERQQWILDKYFEENPDSALKVMVVDFDNQKNLVSQFKAPRQSTLLLYKDGQQLWFSVAETRKRIIHDILNQHTTTVCC